MRKHVECELSEVLEIVLTAGDEDFSDEFSIEFLKTMLEISMSQIVIWNFVLLFFIDQWIMLESLKLFSVFQQEQKHIFKLIKGSLS